jgi:hypothetical protein
MCLVLGIDSQPYLMAQGQLLPAAMAVFLSTVTATAVLAVTATGSPGLSGEMNVTVTFSAPGEKQWSGRPSPTPLLE